MPSAFCDVAVGILFAVIVRGPDMALGGQMSCMLGWMIKTFEGCSSLIFGTTLHHDDLKQLWDNPSENILRDLIFLCPMG